MTDKEAQRRYRRSIKGRTADKLWSRTISGLASQYSASTGVPKIEVTPWFEIIEQERKCWLCAQPASGRMDLDHNHETKVIRGWAHKVCNVAEGYVRSSPDPVALLKTLSGETENGH